MFIAQVSREIGENSGKKEEMAKRDKAISREMHRERERRKENTEIELWNITGRGEKENGE